jgi:hypothetical protein
MSRPVKFKQFQTVRAGESFVLTAAETTARALSTLCSTHGALRNLYFRRVPFTSDAGPAWRVEAFDRESDGSLPSSAYYKPDPSDRSMRLDMALQAAAAKDAVRALRRSQSGQWTYDRRKAEYKKDARPHLNYLLNQQLGSVIRATEHFEWKANPLRGFHKIGVAAALRIPLSHVQWLAEWYAEQRSGPVPAVDDFVTVICAKACKIAGVPASTLRWKHMKFTPHAPGIQIMGPMYSEFKGWVRPSISKREKERREAKQLYDAMQAIKEVFPTSDAQVAIEPIFDTPAPATPATLVAPTSDEFASLPASPEPSPPTAANDDIQRYLDSLDESVPTDAAPPAET